MPYYNAIMEWAKSSVPHQQWCHWHHTYCGNYDTLPHSSHLQMAISKLMEITLAVVKITAENDCRSGRKEWEIGTPKLEQEEQRPTLRELLMTHNEFQIVYSQIENKAKRC